MRISLLIFLCFVIFPMANLLEDENAKMLMEGLRKSLDGLETDRSKIRWDEQGFRVEEKNWQEKAGDWLNNIFEGKRRKRDVEIQTNGNGKEGDSEELIRVNAKIVFYKAKFHWIIAMEQCKNWVEAVAKCPKASAEINDFQNWMIYIWQTDSNLKKKDAADFGRDPWENGSNGGKLERAEDSSESLDDDGKWQWALTMEQKNPYWDKPLYGGGGQQQNDGNRPNAIEIGGNQNQGKQPQKSSPIFPQQIQQPAPPPKPTIWETIETPSTGNGMASSGNVQQNGGKFGGGVPSVNDVGGLANSQTNKHQLSGGQSNQPTSFGQQPANPSPIQPPSPSPTSWLQVQLMSEKPLSPEEIEFAKELMRQILEQEEKRKAVGGGGANGQTSMIGQNGGTGQQQMGGGQTKQQQLGNVQQQPQQKPQNGLPKWAQPKGN